MTTPSPSQQEVTQLLGDWSGGDEGALEKLIPLVQPELHRLAHHYMSRERAGHTLQTTALLNEAYLQLTDKTTAAMAKPHTFYGCCRATNAAHHGGSRARTPLRSNAAPGR